MHVAVNISVKEEMQQRNMYKVKDISMTSNEHRIAQPKSRARKATAPQLNRP